MHTSENPLVILVLKRVEQNKNVTNRHVSVYMAQIKIIRVKTKSYLFQSGCRSNRVKQFLNFRHK